MSQNKLYSFFIIVIAFALTGCAGEPPAISVQNNQTGERTAGLDGNNVAGSLQVNPEAGNSAAQLGSGAGQAQASALQEKLTNVSPDGDGSVTITISDDELTQLIALAQETAVQRGRTLVFQNPTFDFTNGQIIFSSSIDSDRFTGDALVVFAPYLTNNVLQLDLISATVNGRTVPSASLQPIEDTINLALQDLFSQLPPGISLDAVSVQEGVLIITGSVTR